MKNRVAHLGQVSIIGVSDRSSGSQPRSLIFSRMSRILTPVPEPALDSDVARVENVSLFDADREARASRLTFAVGAASLFFVVGPEDSGKSALLRLLSFQGLPARGRVEVLGADVACLSPSDRPRMRRRLGLLFEDQRLLPELDLFANVALAAKIARRGEGDYAPQVSELLLWVGLGGRGAEPISKLTEGEKRRLCLARALVNRPELLILDDPTLGLGDKAERAMMRLIIAVHQAGTPIVFATRDRSLAVNAGGTVHDMPVRFVS